MKWIYIHLEFNCIFYFCFFQKTEIKILVKVI